MFWTILAGIVFLIWYYWNDAIGSTQRVSKSIPRLPGSYPIFGSIINTIRFAHLVNEYLAEVLNAPDFIAGLLTLPFSEPYLMINDPESIEYVTSTKFDHFHKSEFVFEKTTAVLGHGIFAVDSDEWYWQRKVAAKIFTTKSFKRTFETVFQDNIQLFLASLTDAANSGKPIDMQDLFYRFFLDSFAKVSFGADIGSMKEPVPFSKAFDQSQITVNFRFFNPFWKLTETASVKRNFDIVRNFGRDIVQERRANPVKKEMPDLLDLFIEYKDENGNGLTDEQLVDQVINFIIAGRDTTAQALSWCLLCLHKNPRIVTKLLEEASEIMGTANVPTYDQVRQMKYALAVFRETLRMHPSVPRNAKKAMVDEVLPNGTIVPKGVIVHWSAYALGRNPKIWDNPDEFLPERWLDKKLPSQYEYVAFNSGPRICPGKTLAELQGVFLLVSMLKNFSIVVQEPEKVTYDLGLTLPVKYGLFCLVKVNK
jgi:cytochrome P450